MLPAIFHDVVGIKRRIATTSASRDILGNPVYGDPSTWTFVYNNVNVRLAWSGKQLQISSTGELVYPTGTLYLPTSIVVQPEDRLVTVTGYGVPVGIEYIIESVVPSYYGNTLIDHYEAQVHLPII